MTKSYIVPAICVSVNVVILGIIVLKTGWLDKSQLELASLITTALSFIVAVSAVVVSYITFQSQSKSSKESQNLVLLSQVTSELNEIKRAFDISSITDGDRKYFGLDAILFFINNFTVTNDNPQAPFQPQANLFISQVLGHLNKLAQLAKDTESFPFTDPFDARARGYITLVVDDFMKFYEAIFSRIKELLSGRQMNQFNFETSTVRFYLDVNDQHDKLLEELLNLKYLSIVQSRQIDGAEFAAILNRNHENLQRRIDEIREVNYEVKKNN